METRAKFALIGLFTICVIAAAFGFIFWFSGSRGGANLKSYQVIFDTPVTGLSRGGSVLFNGIRVGEVTNLTLDPAAPQQVIATIAVDLNTPIRTDTQVGLETQGLTGGAAVTLRGGSGTSPLVSGEGGAPPVIVAQQSASQDWTQAARDAFQHIDGILAENSEALHDAIANIDTFSDALARNSDKVDGILAGLERMTGGGAGKTEIPVYDLVAASTVPPPPAEAPSWLLVVPEPTTLMGFNTDKILLQPATGESTALPNAKWSDNLPVLFQEKVIQSFENAGYARSAAREKGSPATISS